MLADFLHFSSSNFPFIFIFKCIKIVFFSALASKSGFGAAISDTIMRSVIIFCNLIFANRIVMIASRLFLAAVICVIFLFFAAGFRKSYCGRYIKVATVISSSIAK